MQKPPIYNNFRFLALTFSPNSFWLYDTEKPTALTFFRNFPSKQHYFNATQFWQTDHLKANPKALQKTLTFREKKTFKF